MPPPLPVQEVGDSNGKSLSVQSEQSVPAAKGVTTSATLPHLNGNGEQPSSRMSTCHHHLNVAPQTSFRPSIDTLSEISASSADNTDQRRTGRLLLTTNGPRLPSLSPPPRKVRKGPWAMFWMRNKGMVMVLLSQLFGALMSVTTRLLETSGSGMHPFQVCVPVIIKCKKQLLTDFIDSFCTNEYHGISRLRLHVVGKNAPFPFRHARNTMASSRARFWWVLRRLRSLLYVYRSLLPLVLYVNHQVLTLTHRLPSLPSHR